MKIQVILSCDDESEGRFYEFWPLANYSYQRAFSAQGASVVVTLVYISKTHSFVDFSQNVVKFPRIEGIPSGNQAKVSRMFYASQLGLYPDTMDDIVLLGDIDMVPMNCSKLLESLEKIPNKKQVFPYFVSYGSNAFSNTPNETKYPMCYFSGRARDFSRVVNPGFLNYTDWLHQFKTPEFLSSCIDKKECIDLPPERFSDESLLRIFLIKHNAIVNNIHRPTMDPQRIKPGCILPYIDRVDRSTQGFTGIGDIIVVGDKEFAVDCHMLRPFVLSRPRYKWLFDSIGFEI